MKISENCKRHIQTADLLMQGVKESMDVQIGTEGMVSPEHSTESIKRRLIQARQELLTVSKQLDEGMW